MVPVDPQRPEGTRSYRTLVWPVYGVLAGISLAIGGVADAHALPVIALVVAGVAAALGVTQSAWRGRGRALAPAAPGGRREPQPQP